MDLTTVTDTEAVFHHATTVVRVEGLAPATGYSRHGIRFRTLPRPPGQLLATVATVNDLHLGETECGHYEGFKLGPILRCREGEMAYPENMSRAAVAEMAAAKPDAVVVKGDITARGAASEWATFTHCYRSVFGARLHWVRGNHDTTADAEYPAAGSARTQEVVLAGARLVVLDTSVPARSSGTLTADQLDWLDEVGRTTDRPVLVFAHHHPWDPGSSPRPTTYFGVDADASERLVEVFARRRSLVGYFAGHTHRNRVRRFRATGAVPWVEVCATKDFPGGWAQYRIYEGGILQIFHRCSSPAALAWSEGTRTMFGALYPAYSFGSLADRCFAFNLSSSTDVRAR